MYQEDDSPQPILYEQRHKGLVWSTQFHINNEGMEERHTDLSSTISDLNLKYRKKGSTPCKATRICANG